MTEFPLGARPSYRIGRVQARRIVEWNGQLFRRADAYGQLELNAWEAERDWLDPRFWNPKSDGVTLTIQSFLLETPSQVILVDTGIGNGKSRPAAPPFSNLETPFLDQLRATGITPDDVDIVVLTHLHSDHVGWNTTWVGDAWVPTFRHARYLIPRADYDFFNPAASDTEHVDADMGLVFTDSIDPILNAGQGEFWDDALNLATGIDLHRVPGHTPGSGVLTVRSDDHSAQFVGDLLSTPMMVNHPDLCAHYGEHYVDVNPGQIRAARRDLLTRAARRGTRLVPAHFNIDAGGYITHEPNGFHFVDTDA
ncbi:MBL fold metallo-hydrolase [Streptomyces odonnellii]|uniref:MBL fold metallo-hydrolase n=1 Tax=Streptomyces odonnellii TaxID=1417980 RepID=UPI0007C70B8C|nr:MBL fold metallo-hydrolase [Streptomyces odonnellii]